MPKVFLKLFFNEGLYGSYKVFKNVTVFVLKKKEKNLSVHFIICHCRNILSLM